MKVGSLFSGIGGLELGLETFHGLPCPPEPQPVRGLAVPGGEVGPAPHCGEHVMCAVNNAAASTPHRQDRAVNKEG